MSDYDAYSWVGYSNNGAIFETLTPTQKTTKKVSKRQLKELRQKQAKLVIEYERAMRQRVEIAEDVQDVDFSE